MFKYDKSFYKGKRVLVLGGLGFIGQNLVRALTDLGSEVRVVDLDGVVDRTLSGFPSECTVYYANHCERKFVSRAIASSEIIFNLVGRSGVVDSFQHPLESLKANCLQYLDILQTCQECNRDAVVVFPSSCLVYGKDDIFTQGNESIHPLSPYAIHKYTCEMYSRLYRETYGLSTVVLRISNPIGPYQYRVDGGYGIYNRFIYLAVNDKDITVYGEGDHVRDIIGIDSVVQAFLCCAAASEAVSTVDVGRGVGITVCDYARLVVDTVGSGRVTHVDWPENSKGLAYTNFVADINYIRDITGWAPNTDLRDIIKTTAKFYQQIGKNKC